MCDLRQQILLVDNLSTNDEHLKPLFSPLGVKRLDSYMYMRFDVEHGMNSLFVELENVKMFRFVGLKDPLYQSNPVCSLCNYSTHLLYHLPFLSHLDTIDISTGHLQKLAEVGNALLLGTRL